MLYVGSAIRSDARGGFSVTEAAEGLGDIPGFEATAYYGANERPYTIRGTDARRPLGVVRVSAGFFSLFAVPAAIGRTLVAADFEQRRPVAVLSHAAWMELTGGDAAAVGRTFEFEEGAIEVVGVMPAWFQQPAGGDLRLYVPFLESDLRRRGRVLEIIRGGRAGLCGRRARGRVVACPPCGARCANAGAAVRVACHRIGQGEQRDSSLSPARGLGSIWPREGERVDVVVLAPGKNASSRKRIRCRRLGVSLIRRGRHRAISSAPFPDGSRVA
jgi:hypothetical protein